MMATDAGAGVYNAAANPYEQYAMSKTRTKAPARKSSRSHVDKRSAPTFIETARREQILSAALKIFAVKGFGQTSLAEIAAEVGITKGVISYHFGGKHELGVEVIHRTLRNYGQFVQDRIAQKISAKDKLLEFLDACLEFTEERNASYLTFMDVLGSFGSLADKRATLTRANSRTRKMLTDIIVQGQAAGEIDSQIPAEHLADVLQGVVEGLQEQCAVEPNVVDLYGARRLLRRMLNGFLDP